MSIPLEFSTKSLQFGLRRKSVVVLPLSELSLNSISSSSNAGVSRTVKKDTSWIDRYFRSTSLILVPFTLAKSVEKFCATEDEFL